MTLNISTWVYGIYNISLSDGHGVNGHKVSAFLREKLPLFLDQAYKTEKKNAKKTIEETFEKVYEELIHNSGIDTMFR